MKIKNSMKIALAGASALAMSLAPVHTAQAQSTILGSTTSVALRVFNYYTGTVSFACLNKGSNYTVTVDGIAQTISKTAFTNAISLAGVIGGNITNAAGNSYLYADISTCLPTDTIPGAMLNTSNNIPAGGYITLYFNASDCGFYQASIPAGNIMPEATSYPVSDPQRLPIPYTVSRVFGQPLGTGTVSVAVYVGQSLALSRSYTSPIYVNGAGGTNITSDDVWVDIPTAGYVGPKQSLIIRATRGTTALPGTGNIGANVAPYGVNGWGQ